MGGAKFWQDFKLGQKLGGPISGHTEEYVEKPMLSCIRFWCWCSQHQGP